MQEYKRIPPLPIQKKPIGLFWHIIFCHPLCGHFKLLHSTQYWPNWIKPTNLVVCPYNPEFCQILHGSTCQTTTYTVTVCGRVAIVGPIPSHCMPLCFVQRNDEPGSKLEYPSTMTETSWKIIKLQYCNPVDNTSTNDFNKVIRANMPLVSFHHRCPLNPKCPPLPWWDVLVHPVRWMQRLRLAFCPWTTRAWSAWHFFPNWKDLRIFPMDRSNSEIRAKPIPHWHVSGYWSFLNRGKVHLTSSKLWSEWTEVDEDECFGTGTYPTVLKRNTVNHQIMIWRLSYLG